MMKSNPTIITGVSKTFYNKELFGVISNFHECLNVNGSGKSPAMAVYSVKLNLYTCEDDCCLIQPSGCGSFSAVVAMENLKGLSIFL